MLNPDEMPRVTELLNRLPDSAVIGAEVGVGGGDMSEELLKQHSKLVLFMVDSYEERSDFCSFALEKTQFATSRTRFLYIESVEAARIVPPLDFVFIDASHKYEMVKADIEAWYPKVKSGGILGGHDYCTAEPGVMKAVDEAVIKYGWKLELGANVTWFVRKK